MGAERLEVRALLTAYVVDTTVDESDGNLSAGDLSLREAIEAEQHDEQRIEDEDRDDASAQRFEPIPERSRVE